MLKFAAFAFMFLGLLMARGLLGSLWEGSHEVLITVGSWGITYLTAFFGLGMVGVCYLTAKV